MSNAQFVAAVVFGIPLGFLMLISFLSPHYEAYLAARRDRRETRQKWARRYL